MLFIILCVLGGIAAWVACAILNVRLYRWTFPDGPAFTDRDLLVLLGPVGTVMLGLLAGVGGLLELSKTQGEKLKDAHFITLALITLLVPYFGAAICNHVWYHRVFPDSPGFGDRDLGVLLGPIGTLMLALTAGMGAFLNLCQRLGGARA